MQAMSIFSSNIITEDGIASIMRRLQAELDQIGWRLERSGRIVYIVNGTNDLADMPEFLLDRASEALGDWPKSRFSALFTNNADGFEYKMARAVARAMAEIWTVALDNHAGKCERIMPPGAAPARLN